MSAARAGPCTPALQPVEPQMPAHPYPATHAARLPACLPTCLPACRSQEGGGQYIGMSYDVLPAELAGASSGDSHAALSGISGLGSGGSTAMSDGEHSSAARRAGACVPPAATACALVCAEAGCTRRGDVRSPAAAPAGTDASGASGVRSIQMHLVMQVGGRLRGMGHALLLHLLSLLRMATTLPTGPPAHFGPQS